MTDFHQNFNQFFDGLKLPRQQTNGSEQMPIHSQVGEGGFRRLVPRPDIELVISDFTFHRNRTTAFVTETAMVELNFCLQGTREISVEGVQHEFVPGSYSIQFMKEVGAAFNFKENEPYLMLGIGIPVPTFHRYMEEAGGKRAADFFQMLGHKSYRIFQGSIHPVASLLVQKIMRLAESRGTRNLEVECCVLELLSMSFQSSLIDGSSKPYKLPKYDVQKIHEARDIIIERMTEPPTLLELSRMIGLNDYKLKTGFKELYGTTVFAYLREQRLEKAFHLLRQGTMNVTETSNAVGYSNPSYFSEAFRDKYGVNPGKITRNSSVRLGLTGE
jgi:AraC-like DNA-binding protein